MNDIIYTLKNEGINYQGHKIGNQNNHIISGVVTGILKLTAISETDSIYDEGHDMDNEEEQDLSIEEQRNRQIKNDRGRGF